MYSSLEKQIFEILFFQLNFAENLSFSCIVNIYAVQTEEMYVTFFFYLKVLFYLVALESMKLVS